MTSGAPTANDFPTLDLDELEQAPLRPAVLISSLESQELPGILAAALPAVVHAHHRDERALIDEHQFIDTVSGAAVRYVVSLDERNQLHAQVGESGPAGLWDRLVLTCADWEHAGRPEPTRWHQAITTSTAAATEYERAEL